MLDDLDHYIKVCVRIVLTKYFINNPDISRFRIDIDFTVYKEALIKSAVDGTKEL